MLSKNHPIILFIERNGFSVYQDTLTNIPKFSFTPDLVSNLDVINKDQFASLIATFIQINKIIGSSLAVILADNVIFVKDLTSLVQKPASYSGFKGDLNTDKEHKDEVQNFLEDIPFEEVLAKVIKVGNVNRIVALNKDLAMTIIDVFTGKGSTIETITPSFIYGQSANFAAGLTLDNVRVILENVENLKSGNLLTDQEKMIPFQNLESELKGSQAGANSDLTDGIKKPRNSRQYMLVGVLLVLLIILGVVYLALGSSQTPPQNIKLKSASEGVVGIPTVPPSEEPISAPTLITTVPVDIKNIKIKIIQSSQADEKAANLKNELSKIGFEDIINEVSEASVPEKSSVVFSQNIPADLRNNIITEIKKILPDISILENQDANFTINIMLGKP